MSEEIYKKILNNSATDAEKRDFYQALELDSIERETFYAFKNLYVVSNCDKTKYDKLQRDSFLRFWNLVYPVKQFRLFKFWYTYAAVFIVALTLGFMMHYLIPVNGEKQVFARQIEYTSEKGSVSTIHLEDGSSIWLSSASKITLTTNSTGEISVLLSGEAYFDLIPDPERKLTVDLGFFKVKDVGTKFNIRTYGDEKDVYTTLVDGKIDFFNAENRSVLTMNQGEYMQFNKASNRMTVSRRDPSIATAWKDGKFVFIDKTLAEICRELENWYNVEIIIGNKSLANNKYTSVIKRTTTVNMVMKMLALTDKINYKITDRKEAHDIVYVY
jgi:ferric-dicitrate binding protein FerR (iron transport regulator)